MRGAIIFFFAFLLQSCGNLSINNDLLSFNNETIIRACDKILESKANQLDTIFVRNLLTNIIDVRYSMYPKHYASTPYALRVKCLEYITGKKTLIPIDNDHPDALVIDFYIQWAIEHNIIRSSHDINLIHPSAKLGSNSSQFFRDFIKNYDKVEWIKEYKWEYKPYGTLHN
jgi:hypothetical protein